MICIKELFIRNHFFQSPITNHKKTSPWYYSPLSAIYPTNEYPIQNPDAMHLYTTDHLL